MATHKHNRLTPNDVDIDRLLGVDQPLPEWKFGDLIESIGNAYPTAWLEALIGCSVHVSAYGCVAKSSSIDLIQAIEKFSASNSLDTEWFALMTRALERADECAGDELAVRQWHMRGVVDMLAAYFGESQLCPAVYDSPEAAMDRRGGYLRRNRSSIIKSMRRVFSRPRCTHNIFRSRVAKS